MRYIQCEPSYEKISQAFNIDGVKYTFPLFFKGDSHRVEISGFKYGPLYIFGKEDDLVFFEKRQESTPHWDYVEKHEIDNSYSIDQMRYFIKNYKINDFS